MKNLTLMSVLFAYGALCSSSFAQESSWPSLNDDERQDRPYTPKYGINVGFDQMLSSRTRGVFGNVGINISPGFGPTSDRKGLKVVPDFSFFSASKQIGGLRNRAFHFLIGPGLRYGFVDPFEVVDGTTRYRTFAPYGQISLGVGFADVNVRSVGREQRGFTYGMSFALGTSITKNAYVEARYRLMPKIASFDFSTLGIELGVRF